MTSALQEDIIPAVNSGSWVVRDRQRVACRSILLCLRQVVFLLGGKLTPDHGSISEPLAIGVYAVKKSMDIKGAAVGILGFGPIGMSVMLAAKAQGAGNFFVTDKIDARLSIALKEGADIYF